MKIDVTSDGRIKLELAVKEDIQLAEKFLHSQLLADLLVSKPQLQLLERANPVSHVIAINEIK
jgi:hypothetical protein